MASNNIPEEKPNSRPRKHLDANGKSLSHNQHWKQREGGSLIYARWNNPVHNTRRTSFDQPGLFGLEQPYVPVSLNKQQRWKLFDDIRQKLANSSDSSSEEELSPSPTKERRKNRSDKPVSRSPQEPPAISMEIISPAGELYTRVRREPLPRRLRNETTHSDRTSGNRAPPVPIGVTYVAVTTSRKKSTTTVRTKCGKKSKHQRIIGGE